MSVDCVVIVIATGEIGNSCMYKVGGVPAIDHVIDAALTLENSSVIVLADKAIAKSIARRKRLRFVVSDDSWKALSNTLHKLHCHNVLLICGDAPIIKHEAISCMFSIMNSSKVDGSMTAVVLNSHAQQVSEVEVRALSQFDSDKAGTWDAMGMLSHVKIVKSLVDELSEDAFDVNAMAFSAINRGLSICCVNVGRIYASRVRDKVELAAAEHCYQLESRERIMLGGVNIIAPDTLFVGYGTTIGKETTIHPYVVIGPHVEIGEGVEIKSFSNIENSYIAKNAIVGPFARITDSTIGSEAVIGNFAEVKRSKLSRKVKMKHLGYLGDTVVKESVNLGAGFVTCNYDGKNKHKTLIEKNCFIGANASLIAPINIGEGAAVAAGSVITNDVDGGDLAIERSEQRIIKGGWRRRGK